MAEKHYQYAALIHDVILKTIKEEGLWEELTSQQDDNLTPFIHAMATIAPNSIFNKLTGQEVNNLEFNHVANQLVFQFSKMEG